ncbi:MAG: serine hydrolase domain-containing protein [Oligoflexales bacterium]
MQLHGLRIFILFFLFYNHGFASLNLNPKDINLELKENNFFSKTPGTVLSLCKLENCSNFAAGYVDPASPEAIKSSGSYRIGSLTKSMVAVLIMQAVEDGLISLGDTLGKLLPEYQKWHSVTVKQLLRMESGVPPYLFSQKYAFGVVYEILRGNKKRYAPSEILNSIKESDLIFTPGNKSEYNNSNYILLGLILEKVRNDKLQNILKQGILDPLQLNNTYLDDGSRQHPNLTKGFIHTYTLGLPYFSVFLFPKEKRRGFDMVEISNGLPATRVWAAGAVISTSTDMTTFIRSLLTGNLLSQNSLEQMQEFVITKIIGMPFLYGLGLMAYPTEFGTLYGHGGIGVGYQNMTYYLPEFDLSIALAQNVGPTSTFVYFEKVLDILFDKFKKEPFIPMDHIINENFSRGLHIRVKGQLANSAVEPRKMPSTIGYAFDSKRFVPGQSFNQFYIETKIIDEEEWIQITGISMSLFASLSANGQSKLPMSLILIKKAALKEARENGRNYISLQGQFDSAPIFATTGNLTQNSESQKFEPCAARVIEPQRRLNLQFGTNKSESFGQGETIKILGNIPLRNIRSEDYSKLTKFGLKQCTETPKQQ